MALAAPPLVRFSLPAPRPEPTDHNGSDHSVPPRHSSSADSLASPTGVTAWWENAYGPADSTQQRSKSDTKVRFDVSADTGLDPGHTVPRSGSVWTKTEGVAPTKNTASARSSIPIAVRLSLKPSNSGAPVDNAESAAGRPGMQPINPQAARMLPPAPALPVKPPTQARSVFKRAQSMPDVPSIPADPSAPATAPTTFPIGPPPRADSLPTSAFPIGPAYSFHHHDRKPVGPCLGK